MFAVMLMGVSPALASEADLVVPSIKDKEKKDGWTFISEMTIK